MVLRISTTRPRQGIRRTLTPALGEYPALKQIGDSVKHPEQLGHKLACCLPKKREMEARWWTKRRRIPLR
jgi:hypothetical protein